MRPTRLGFALVLALSAACTREARIAEGLAPEDASRELARLERRGLRGRLVAAPGGAELWVDEELATLARARLPRRPQRPTSLIRTPEDDRLAREDELAERLEALIEALPEVLDATVVVELARTAQLDAPERAPHVSVVAEAVDPEAARPAIRELLPEGAEVEVHPAPAVASVELVRVGPLRVAAADAPRARLLVGASLAINLLLSIGIAARVVQRRMKR